MLPTILMRRFQIMQLLIQIRDIGFQLGRFRRESLLHIGHWAEDEPDLVNQREARVSGPQ